jgi:hypothetical protein
MKTRGSLYAVVILVALQVVLFALGDIGFGSGPGVATSKGDR